MNRVALIVIVSIIAVAGITILILWLTGVLFKSVDHSNDYISGGFMLDPRIENYKNEIIPTPSTLSPENQAKIDEHHRLKFTVIPHLHVIKENLKNILNGSIQIDTPELIKMIRGNPDTKPPNDLNPLSITDPLEESSPQYNQSLIEVERIIKGVEVKIDAIKTELLAKGIRLDSRGDVHTGANEQGGNMNETEGDVKKELNRHKEEIKKSKPYIDLEQRDISIAGISKKNLLHNLVMLVSTKNMARDARGVMSPSRKQLVCKNKVLVLKTFDRLTNSIPGLIVLRRLLDMMRPPMIITKSNGETTELKFFEFVCSSEVNGKTSMCKESEPDKIIVHVMDMVQGDPRVEMFGINKNSKGKWSFTFLQDQKKIYVFEDQTDITKSSEKTIFKETEGKFYDVQDTQNSREEKKYYDIVMSGLQFKQLMKMFYEKVAKNYELSEYDFCN